MKTLYRLVSILSYAFTMLVIMGYMGYLMGFEFPFTYLNDELTLSSRIMLNMVLLTVFGVQHSLMARKWFKEGIKNIVGPKLYRSFYISVSAILLMVIMAFWQPLGFTIFMIESVFVGSIIYSLQFLGWSLVLLSTFQIDHFHFFGLKQAFSREKIDSKFKVPFLYRMVRHPLYLGLLLVHWATPELTGARFMLASGMTIYLFVGMYFEEKDMTTEFGRLYSAYKARVPKIIPIKF